MSGSVSDSGLATFMTCRVVSRHVLYVSRHFVRVHCACERRHFVPAVMSSRHLRFVATRHLPSRHLFVVMSRHIATCRDMSRRNATYTHLCCFNFIYIFVFSLCSDDIVHVPGYSVNLATSWQDIYSDPRVQIPLWPILLSLGCTHTPSGVPFCACKIIIEIEYYF